MYSHLLRLNGLYARFGQESLDYGDLEKITKALCQPPPGWRPHCQNIAIVKQALGGAPSAVFYNEGKNTYDIILDVDNLTPEQRTYWLAYELGHVYLHGPEPMATVRNFPERGAEVSQQMDEEALYFALCCFIPHNVVAAAWNSHSGWAGSIQGYLMQTFLPTLRQVDLSPSGMGASQLLTRRIRGFEMFEQMRQGHP